MMAPKWDHLVRQSEKRPEGWPPGGPPDRCRTRTDPRPSALARDENVLDGGRAVLHPISGSPLQVQIAADDDGQSCLSRHGGRGLGGRDMFQSAAVAGRPQNAKAARRRPMEPPSRPVAALSPSLPETGSSVYLRTLRLDRNRVHFILQVAVTDQARAIMTRQFASCTTC